MKAETQYLERDGVRLAYQVFGSQPRDLILVPGAVSNIEFMHKLPGYSQFIERLSQSFRVTTFDKRGNGLSGRLKDAPTIEERMDDIRFVMDEIGSERAVVFGFSEGGALSVLYAAMHPQRVERLIVFGSFAVPPGMEKILDKPKFIRRFLMNRLLKKQSRTYTSFWGSGRFARTMLPSKLMVDGKMRTLLKEFETASSDSENMMRIFRLLAEFDIRPFLNDVHCPTLVMHSRDDHMVPFSSAHPLHEQIENAEFVELNEAGHIFFMHESEQILSKILEFATDGLSTSQESDGRILATILFNDIVDSTKLQSEFGDKEWRDKMDQFHALAQEAITRFEGRYIKSMGDGILAIFDGPTRAIKCAFEIKEAVKSLGLDVRTGLHGGEIERLHDDISGINVNAASRIQSLAEGDQILVSDILKTLVFGSGITFKDFGQFELKGFDEKWQLNQVIRIDD